MTGGVAGGKGRLSAMREAFWHAAAAEGSTRALGLMRLGLVAILWSRFANPLIAFRHQEIDWLILAILFWVATIPLFLGFMTRLAAPLAAAVIIALIGWLGALGGYEPFTHHHTGLLAILTALMAMTPCGRSFSVDRLLAVRRARRAGAALPPEAGPLWATHLMALQLSAVYFFGAVDKLSVAFLSGARMEHIFVSQYTGSLLPTHPAFGPTMMALAVGTVALELALAFGLWHRGWQRWLIPLGVAFHVIIYATLPVQTFSATMIVFYLAYVDPAWVHGVVDEVMAEA